MLLLALPFLLLLTLCFFLFLSNAPLLRTLIVPPKWKIEPSDQSAVIGDRVTFDCAASGHPHPLIRWKISSTGLSKFLSPFSSHMRSLFFFHSPFLPLTHTLRVASFILHPSPRVPVPLCFLFIYQIARPESLAMCPSSLRLTSSSLFVRIFFFSLSLALALFTFLLCCTLHKPFLVCVSAV